MIRQTITNSFYIDNTIPLAEQNTFYRLPATLLSTEKVDVMGVERNILRISKEVSPEIVSAGFLTRIQGQMGGYNEQSAPYLCMAFLYDDIEPSTGIATKTFEQLASWFLGGGDPYDSGDSMIDIFQTRYSKNNGDSIRNIQMLIYLSAQGNIENSVEFLTPPPFTSFRLKFRQEV